MRGEWLEEESEQLVKSIFYCAVLYCTVLYCNVCEPWIN